MKTANLLKAAWTICLFISATALLRAQIPFSNTYTIGIDSSDFSSFQEDSLHLLGVADPVTLNVLSGTYNEQIRINTKSAVILAIAIWQMCMQACVSYLLPISILFITIFYLTSITTKVSEP